MESLPREKGRRKKITKALETEELSKKAEELSKKAEAEQR